jgi:DNA-binding response OmpR family regulator
MTLIFIIEDNENIADSLSYFIKYLAHYDSLIANSAEVAYETLMKGVSPDLILLDVKLPGMDGIDFLSRIHRDPLLKGVKVIIYTGMPENKVREKLEERNIFVAHIIQKPTTPSGLIAVIDDELKGK